MNSTLYLPKKIKVGYQNRSNTYTGKLAYVIYYDSKGKLRKESSWESWRNKEIPAQEFENVPTEGFVLNKKVGDYVCNWNHRQAYTRVYDPRGFEFEITIENLLYILENTSSIKGKGLEGEFVYAWNGAELVLMPTCSPDFKDITEYNEVLQSNKKFNSKNMIVGATYRTKNNTEVVYIGRYPVYGSVYEFDGKEFTTYRKMENYARSEGKKLYEWVSNSYSMYGHRKEFYKEKTGITGKEFWFAHKVKMYGSDNDKWLVEHKTSASEIIDVVDENCHAEYAEIFDAMESRPDYSPYVPEKDEKVFYTLEEFVKEANSWCTFRGFNYNTILFKLDENNFALSFKIIKEDDKIFIAPERYQARMEIKTLCSIFKNEVKQSKNYYGGVDVEFALMTPEEFVNNYHPFYRKLYLENGKFWKNVGSEL